MPCDTLSIIMQRIVVSHRVVGRLLRALHVVLSDVEALRLEAPQVALFCLNDGEVTQISYRINWVPISRRVSRSFWIRSKS